MKKGLLQYKIITRFCIMIVLFSVLLRIEVLQNLGLGKMKKI